jgi:hypothetical protein
MKVLLEMILTQDFLVKALTIQRGWLNAMNVGMGVDELMSIQEARQMQTCRSSSSDGDRSSISEPALPDDNPFDGGLYILWNLESATPLDLQTAMSKTVDDCELLRWSEWCQGITCLAASGNGWHLKAFT